MGVHPLSVDIEKLRRDVWKPDGSFAGFDPATGTSIADNWRAGANLLAVNEERCLFLTSEYGDHISSGAADTQY